MPQGPVWHNNKSISHLWPKRSQVRTPAGPLPDNSLGQAGHMHVPVTKQYNLVPADGRWHSSAGKVTTGLAESNGSLPLGGWLSHLQADCLYTGISSGPMLGNKYGKNFYHFTTTTTTTTAATDTCSFSLTKLLFQSHSRQGWILLKRSFQTTGTEFILARCTSSLPGSSVKLLFQSTTTQLYSAHCV